MADPALPGTLSTRQRLYPRAGKRLLDLTVSVATLPFQLAVALVVAPLIRLEDGGPVMYTAMRRGRNGVPFRMYKYRTMSVGAPDLRNADGSTFNGEADPRVTRVGRFLRRSSLDELPQLLNVIRGDMSLVGPRPNLTGTPVGELSDLELKRLRVRPGITGYSQAFFRNSIRPEQRYGHDSYYVDHLSLRLDLRILLETVTAVALQRGLHIASSTPNGTAIITAGKDEAA